MTPDQIQRLRDLAARATPGPWSVPDSRIPDYRDVVSGDFDPFGNPVYVARCDLLADAEYLAALSPEVLVGLLDELERLRERDRVERIHQARLAELQREVDDYRAAERPSDWERGL